MAIKLHELIDQVRDELLMPRRADTLDAMYPFLFVDEVELDLSVTVSAKVEGSGKVSIQVIEVGGGSEAAGEDVHSVKIKMTPLLTKEEIREQLKKNGRLWQTIENVTRRTMVKEDGMVGES